MQDVYDKTIARLTRQFDPAEARSLSRILFEDFFQWKSGRADRRLRDEEQHTLQTALLRLEQGEPIQYITGIAYFHDICLRVNPSVLIPRPETEELVEWILETAQAWKKDDPAVSVLDIGTGSGCIPLALKKAAPYLITLGVDISQEALDTARHNAEQLDLSVAFQHIDILDQKQWETLGTFDVIVSNPPYIPQQERQLMQNNVLNYEPAQALFVTNEDPLIFYRRILAFAKHHLSAEGLLFFECNEFNAPTVLQLCQQVGYSHLELRQDLQGKDRMIRAKR